MSFYDRNGNQISITQWSVYVENDDYRAVAHTEVYSHVVSTVWLGLDYGFGLTPKPLIFESLVTLGKDYVDMRRYATLAEAQRGHNDLVHRLAYEYGDE